MLELRCNEPASGLGVMVATDARLSVAFQLIERDGDGGAMRLAYPVITANERGERRGFRSGKGRVPTRPVLPTALVVEPSTLAYSWAVRSRTNCSPVCGSLPSASRVKCSSLAAPVKPSGPASLPCHSPCTVLPRLY
jgi:hypothetical protein